jgi:uncharacterized protein YndB with AHSA1/START domain
MRRTALLLFPAIILTACSNASERDRTALAAAGQIQQNAPVKADVQISINASPDKVWSILTNINNWPRWQTAISAAQVHGPLAPGTAFTWSAGKMRVESQLALVKPVQQIAWTGTAMKAHAIHVWTLEALPTGGTLVKTTESMDGFLLAVLYTSQDLAESDQLWLANLKREAEKP